MSERYPELRQPENDSATLWRYMGFEHFVSMLVHGGLRFTCVSELAKDDPYEFYRFSQIMHGLGERSSVIDASFDQAFSGEDKDKTREFIQDLDDHIDQLEELCHDIERWAYVNCWHLNEGESAAMWQLHADRGAGIAITCTFAKLRSLLGCGTGLGLVEYLEESRFRVGVTGFNINMRKRKSFAHEREVRALKPVKTETGFLHGGGIWQPVDLNGLIDEIMLGPTAPEWLVEVVEKVAKKYDLTAPVNVSGLLKDPFPEPEQT